MQTVNDSRMVAPALKKYVQGPLAELWKRPGLTPRDRSIVTIAALFAHNQTIEIPHYFQRHTSNVALDNGLKPREILRSSRLDFHSGWANAMSAVVIAKEVFAEPKIRAIVEYHTKP
jgi:4-carboxymuconolactone decarboxylase